jgi:Uma2 family endonuclease
MPASNQKYTYKDYLSWPDDQRWEIIDGVAYAMTAPSWQHQRLSGRLYTQFSLYLAGKTCEIFAAPFDLRLPEESQTDLESTHTVQPDLTIICDQSKLKGTGYCGTPSMIIEILSPATGKQDKIRKFNRYESAGVKEYWIVDPTDKVVSVFTLQGNGRYGRPDNYSDEDKIPVSILPDLEIDLKPVFEGLE